MHALEEMMRRAAADGAFDNLQGAGKPIPDLDDRRPAVDRWLEKKCADEGLSLPLPTGLQLKVDVANELQRLRASDDEREVRAGLAAVNARIAHANARHLGGPTARLAPFDIDDWVRRWRVARHG